MSFVCSLLKMSMGTLGDYSIFGTHVAVVKNDQLPCATTIFEKLFIFAGKMIEPRFIRVLTGGYLHVFVHEMGHAIADKIGGGCNHRITIHQNTVSGFSTISHAKCGTFYQTLSLVGGPVASVVFSVSKIALGNALYQS